MWLHASKLTTRELDLNWDFSLQRYKLLFNAAYKIYQL